MNQASLQLPHLWQPAVQQGVYRQLLQAMSYPGRVCSLASLLDGEHAQDAVIACLVDHAVSCHVLDQVLSPATWRFCAPQAASASEARWLVADGGMPVADDLQPNVGTLEEPECGATVCLRVAACRGGAAVTARGPGIATHVQLAPQGLHPSWWAARNRWCARFPLGVDLIVASADAIVALPRTTIIDDEEH